MSTAREIIEGAVGASFTAGFNSGALMGLQSFCDSLVTLADIPQVAAMATPDALRFIAHSMEKGGNAPFKADDQTAEIAPLTDAVIAALAEAGWQIVPAEPTEEMQNAARDWSIKKNGQGVGHDQSRGCYQAMLAAATLPPPPAKQGG